MEKSKVYYCKEVTPEKLVEMYKRLGKELKGNVAVKVHSGEEGNQNYLKPEFFKSIIDYVNGTVVECNTAYSGERNTTEKHLKTIEKHGWSKLFKFDLMDAEGPDVSLEVEKGKHLHEDFVGKNIEKYDSMLVLSHFKGHPMGGYGGALKQLSIGCASSEGKAWIHSAGTNKDQYTLWNNLPEQDDFLESMAEDELIGYRSDYVPGEYFSVDNTCDLENIADLDFEALSKAYKDMLEDMILLSQEHILVFDLPLNVIFDGEKLTAIDTCAYQRVKRDPLQDNINSLNRTIEIIFDMWFMNYKDIFYRIEGTDIDSYLEKIIDALPDHLKLERIIKMMEKDVKGKQ